MNKMGGVCGMHEREEKCMQDTSGKTNYRDLGGGGGWMEDNIKVDHKEMS